MEESASPTVNKSRFRLESIEYIEDPSTTHGSPRASLVDDKQLSEVDAVAALACVESQSPDKDPEQARKWRRKHYIHYVTLCWCFFLEGWNDSSTGPLLPRIQSEYNLSYAVVSLIFIFLCVGFFFGAMLNIYLNERLGFGKVITLGTAIQMVVYAIIIPAPPFPVLVLSFALYGFGTTLQNAQVNAFVAGLNSPRKMGILHAVYGVGALSSPFVATQFATAKHWSYHYFTLLALSTQMVAILIIVFRFKTQNEVLESCGMRKRAVNTSQQNSYRQIMSLSTVHLLSFFLIAYCGCEITIGGWAVTYIVRRTGGGPSSGYVSSGFFGGLSLGRVALIWPTKKIGERTAIVIYGVIAIGLEIFIWAFPKEIPSAIAISLVGLFLGPMFPMIMNQCGTLLPPHLLTGAIGVIVSLALLGDALVPFATGALADRFGIVSLQPLLILMMVFMLIIWLIVVYKHRKRVNLQIV